MNSKIFALILMTIVAPSVVSRSVKGLASSDEETEAAAATVTLSLYAISKKEIVNRTQTNMITDYANTKEKARNELETIRNKVNGELDALRASCKGDPKCVACFEPQTAIKTYFSLSAYELESVNNDAFEKTERKIRDIIIDLSTNYMDKVDNLLANLNWCQIAVNHPAPECLQTVITEANTYNAAARADDSPKRANEEVKAFESSLQAAINAIKNDFSDTCAVIKNHISNCNSNLPPSTTAVTN